MKTKFFTICSLLVAMSMLTACTSKEDRIKEKAKVALSQLAVMSTIYLVDYSNFKDSILPFNDDFYIKKSKETHEYGFDVAEVLKNIKVENDTLIVKLPKPKKLSMTESRTPVFLLKSSPSFNPKTEDGDLVDVEKIFTERVNEQESRFNELIAKDAETYTRLYFEALAKTFGLKSVEFH